MATIRNSISSLLVLSAVLIIFASTVSAAADPEQVRDIEGKLVRSGVRYFILPAMDGSGGGLYIGSNRNGSCPFDVIQSGDEQSNGIPATFTPVDPKKGVIRVSTDLNIQFPGLITIICDQPPVWKLSFDGSIDQYFVTIGGVEGNPGAATLSNWFKIERTGDDDNHIYKLSFCPTVCTTCGRVICMDIGIYVDDKGVRRLTLSDEPFKVVFKKV